MTYQVALTFEDGVTQFIECRPNETVADASYRARINIPLDCRDGACGTCKSFCESGTFDPGDYIEDALTDDEADEGYVLTCQMLPESDCIVRVPATSDVAKTGVTSHAGQVSTIEVVSDSTSSVALQLADPGALKFLPGQYVNIQIPGTDQTRSYSFASSPNAVSEVSFLLRNTETGALPTYLRERAKVGDAITFNGPLGSFYLRAIERPVLFLAGGTGLAPFLSMLEKIGDTGTDQPVHLVFGVTFDDDLVRLDQLEAYTKKIPGFTYECCVAAEDSTYANKGYVTRYVQDSHLNGGDVDIYLCGPPAMVDAVRGWLRDQGVTPNNFYYEKFSGTGVVQEIGEEHLKTVDSDEAFDTKMTIEMGAAQLTVGKLPADRLAELRRLAEATAPFISGGRFTDVAGFRSSNAAFHRFIVDCADNGSLRDAYNQLRVQEYMAQALTPDVAVSDDIVKDHLDLVEAYEQGDLDRARAIIIAHTARSKETMRAGIEKGAP